MISPNSLSIFCISSVGFEHFIKNTILQLIVKMSGMIINCKKQAFDLFMTCKYEIS